MKRYNLRGVRFREKALPLNAYQLIFDTSTDAEFSLAVSFADYLGACDYTSAPGVFACTITGDTMEYQLPWRLDRFNAQ